MLVQYCYANNILEEKVNPEFYEGYDLDEVLPKQIYLDDLFDEHRSILLKHGAIIENNYEQ